MSRQAPPRELEFSNAHNRRASVGLAPATMKPIGTVDERFQSYNVEMLEVTGGEFWKPYEDIAKMPTKSAPTKTADAAGAAAQGSNVPAGMSADLYQYRPPLKLENPRLRAMAKALAPAYMRISGT